MFNNLAICRQIMAVMHRLPNNTCIIPSQTRARYCSIILCTTAAVLIIVFCVVNRSVDEYYPDATQKNTTNVCYRKKEKLTFPGLFTTALSLFGVVLGTLVDRLSLIAEERHHIQSRYDGNCMKMFKACFSGIVWPPVIVLLGLAALIIIILSFVTSKFFELSYLVYIFGGIGVGPLIMQLLNLNTQSKVHISTILEEKQANVANGLAWSYYFNFLEEALLKFKEKVPRKCNKVELEDQEERVQLNSNKLILLITHDRKTTDDLPELDNHIEKLGEFKNGKYIFPVYELTCNGCKYRYVIKYVKQPLETLVKFSHYERVEILNEKRLEYQVKLLYKTLYEIVKNPLNSECKDGSILIGIHARCRQYLNNGNLASVIKKQVEADESPREHKVNNGMERISMRKNNNIAITKQTNAKAKTKDNNDLLEKIEKNIDTPYLPNQRSASKVSVYSEQEVIDYASGASTSGIEMANLLQQQQQQDSSKNAHENQANTADQL